ncbi:hypothetical protein ACLKA6_008693 [Drosophila palustris]
MKTNRIWSITTTILQINMPADPTEEAPPQVPKTELDELQIKAQGVADESLESTRRMLALCEERPTRSEPAALGFHFEIEDPNWSGELRKHMAPEQGLLGKGSCPIGAHRWSYH